MNYLFGDQWYEVPAYAPYPNCLLVKIHYSLFVKPVKPTDQRVIEKSWRKVWRFMLAEGPSRTIRKVRSKRVQDELTRDYHIVVVAGVLEGGESAVCLGTRHPRCAEVMLFRQDLIEPMISIGSERDFARGVTEAVASLSLSDSDWDAISGYNLYSEQAPPNEALRLIQSVASSIKSKNSSPDHQTEESKEVIRPPEGRARPSANSRLQGVVVIGAGDYARTQIIPALQRAGITLHSVVDLEPYVAEYARSRFGFMRAFTDWRHAVAQPETNLVIVASYHDSHAEIAAAALNSGKKVFLEKPPAVTREDLSLLLEASNSTDGFLEIGYNRRFAPFSRKAKQLLDEVSGPTSIVCVVKEVDIPDRHWYRWPKEGTRITGNICHWIDLGIFLLGEKSEPTEMTITGPNLKHLDDEKGLNIVFRDGSSLSIVTTSRGDDTLGVQELIQIRRGSLTIEVNDYRRLLASNKGIMLSRLYGLRDKGHERMYAEAFRRIKENLPPLYTRRELELTALITINATEMIRQGLRSRPWGD